MAGDLVTRARRLSHPLVTGALAALVVNDRVLKGWSAGADGWTAEPARALTGKISDVAGVLLVALLVGIATGRRRATLVAVGLAFVALKTSTSVAAEAAPVLGGVTRTDVTDLVALLALVPAGWFLARGDGAGAVPERPAIAAGGVARRAPGPVLTGLVLLLCVPAITATSCTEADPLDTLAVAADGDLYARIGPGLQPDARELLATMPPASAGDPGRPGSTSVPLTDERETRVPDLTSDRWARSTDAGRTWAEVDAPLDAAALLAQVPETETCTSEGTCYRVTRDDEGHGVVEERGDGAWTTSFAFSDDQWQRMELRSDDCSATADSGDGFRSVTTVDDVVLVPMGSQGLLRRQGSGDWERIAVAGTEPLRVDGPSWFADLVGAPGLLALAAPVLFVLALLLGRGWWRGLLGGGLALLGAAGLGALTAFLDVSGTDYAELGPGIALASLVVFAVSVAVAVLPGRRPRPAPDAGPVPGWPPAPPGGAPPPGG